MDYQFEALGPTLRWISLLFLFVAVIAFVAVIVAVAALPGWIAKRRAHPQAAAINVCGWFGLPTGILWVVAIVWAYVDSNPTGSAGASANNTASHSDISRLKTQLVELNELVTKMEGERQ